MIDGEKEREKGVFFLPRLDIDEKATRRVLVKDDDDEDDGCLTTRY